MVADLYEEIGVARDASPEAIKAAGRKAARDHHPDRGGDEEKMKRVTHALSVLRDPEKRRRYDETGDDASRAAPADPVTPQILRAFEMALAASADADPRYFDLATEMRRQLLHECAAGEDANENIKATIEKLKTIQKRLRFKGEGDGPIARVLADRIQLNERNVAQNVEVMAHMRAAAAFVDEWLEYQTDERPEPAHFGFKRTEVDIAELLSTAARGRGFFSIEPSPGPGRKP